MIKNIRTPEAALDNLRHLTDLYMQYRDLQYTLIEQYDKVLEDPRYDELYLDMTPVTKYRKYIEEDINGTSGCVNTTTIIKEFIQLQRQFEIAAGKIEAGDSALNAIKNYQKNFES